MRHKSTVYNTEQHNQFEPTREQRSNQKQIKDIKNNKEGKEGQSEFRIEKTVGRQVITK